MKRSVLILSLMMVLVVGSAWAVSDEDMARLRGKNILYSSPFESGDKAVMLHGDDIQLSDDFTDDGLVIIQKKAYPIDQLFIKNVDGRYENLAYLLKYNGISATYFIRYYDEHRLALKDEIEKLKQQATNCVGDYTGGGSESVAAEAGRYGACLDGIFYRSVDLFYSLSAEQMLADYAKQSELWTRFYFNMANPDNCFGKCGTVAEMQAYGKVVEAKKNFILDLLNTPQLGDDTENH